jgi:hypothetical protein
MKNAESGEIEAFHKPSELPGAGVPRPSGLPLTVAALEDRLVAVHGLWRRTPGDGPSPFARDIPAHLILREVGDIVGEYSETLLTNQSGKELLVRKVVSRAPRAALSTAEVGERGLVTGWLGLVADPLDRKLVWLATAHLARGEDAPAWGEIKRVVGAAVTPQRLGWRYRQALAVMLCRLHQVPVRHARVIALGGVAALRS